jgi:GNAT superfamily N-acetyltransferase
MPNLRTETFREEFLLHFVALNLQWIEHYLAVEQADREQLEMPQENILKPGGEIFFVLEGEKVLGTCAMILDAPGHYELAKMAITPEARGKGAGSFLLSQVIHWAKERGAQEIHLLSNTKLAPAIALYEKHGFEIVRLGPNPLYARCNIEMKLNLINPG